MIDRASGSPRVTACITAIGAGGYHRAAEGAARSVLEHTDWDLVLVADRPLPAALSRDPRVSGIRIDPVVGADRAGRFLAKFDALERAIGVSDTPLMRVSCVARRAPTLPPHSLGARWRWLSRPRFVARR